MKKESPQGTELDDYREVSYNNVRNVTIYNQFETRALFTFLRMSDATRQAYTENYCGRRGMTVEAKEEFLKRQLEENKHWFTYVALADIRDKTGVSLGEKNAQWTFALDIGAGRTLVPESIKEIDVEPEIQHFFGRYFNLFKTAYLVKFPHHDASGKTYTCDDQVTIVVSSPYKKAEVVWNEKEFKEKKNVKKDEDFYWS